MALVDVTNKVGFQSGLRTCYHSNKAHSLNEETVVVLQNSLLTVAYNNVSGESKIVLLYNDVQEVSTPTESV